MIIVRLKGGLGNQMFEYAFAKGTASRLGVDFKLDSSWLLDKRRGDQSVFRDYSLDIFNLKCKHVIHPRILRMIYRITGSWMGRGLRKQIEKRREVLNEQRFGTDQEILIDPPDETLFMGHWQGIDYFKNVESELRKDFEFRKPILETSKKLLDAIQSSNSVCINVRRAEFLKIQLLNTTDLKYFKRAVGIIVNNVEDPKLFVFSEDLDWCREYFDFPIPTVFVEHEHDGLKYGNYLQLMAACKHFVIPNSTYAWWAAWLGTDESKVVVAPKLWFANSKMDTTNLIPSDWLRT